MFPYFEQITFALGPLTLHVWGLFIALGIIAAMLVARRDAARYKISFDIFLDLAMWTLIAAFVGSRLSHVFFYEPHYFLSHPVEIFKIWQGGMSSLGGIIVGTVTAVLFVAHYKLDIRAYGDVVARCMPIAWAIGRFGCYVTHMHPGASTTMPWGVRYSDGTRLDLGLLESVVWILIALVVWLIPRSKRPGFYLALVPLLYAPARFILDFFRTHHDMSGMFIADARYAGLTPAQYGMIGLFLLGWYLAYKFKLLKRYDV